ncbi:MAG: sugar phosphate nucleotidyltransferase [Bacteroidota bacterium]
MKIIIPMAGRGSRLRPHTLTTPKPLYPIAGKPIVQRLVEDIVALYDGKVEEIAFVIGDFGAAVEQQLKDIAAGLGAVGRIYYQDEPLGTAHAIWMAQEVMDGEVIIAFADTLFVANFKLDRTKDGAIWVKAVEDPRAFGVVTLNEDGIIDELVEKPQEFVSDLAIIGIYYIRDGAALREEIRHLLDNDLKEKGEFQLTNALENMKQKGAQLVPGKVDEWMDCGNKANVLDTTQRILDLKTAAGENLVAADLQSEHSVVIPPCHIGSGVTLKNAIIGPHVSIGDNTSIENSVIAVSIVGEDSKIADAVLKNSMVGNHAAVEYAAKNLDIGDYCRTRLNE